MRCIITSTLGLYLLTLLGSCQQTSQKSSTLPPVRSADEAGLHRAIRENTKPYVLVNFWATYCKPCLKEIPDLVNVHNDSTLGVNVILVSLDDVEKDEIAGLGTYLAELGVDFSSLHLPTETAYRFIEGHYPGWNNTIPLNFIFTNEGRLITQTSMIDHSEVMMIVNKDKMFR